MKKRNFSSKRNAIYDALCDTTCHPSAKWIYEKLKPEIPDLSLATVHRNINVFKEDGLVSVICSVNGEERVDAVTHPHPHFVCDSCGCVYDVTLKKPESTYQHEIADKGFVVEKKYLLYHGTCPKCSKTDCTHNAR